MYYYCPKSCETKDSGKWENNLFIDDPEPF